MHKPVTIVGGGVGGLITAIAAREVGVSVRLLEAKEVLGGRGRSLDGPYKANWGPHVLYGSTELWKWLDSRGLGEPAARPVATAPIRFRYRGKIQRMPPPSVMRAAFRLARMDAPSETSFLDWGTEVIGDEAIVRHAAALAGPLMFTHEPWHLSAAFVRVPLRQITSIPSSARYLIGGWTALISRLEAHARRLGAEIELQARVTELPPPPVVVATQIETAARLLRDSSLRWRGTQVATLDVGLRRRRGDTYLLFDLDEAGWAAAYTVPDPSLAPHGEHLVQAQVALAAGEELDRAIARVEKLLDGAYPQWRSRLTWRRKLKIVDQTGAVDEPGTSWRDRPAVDRGDDVYVVSDKSAAPGLLSEVSFHAALKAVAALVGESDHAAA
jgi:glycine/D-amino acid oxidase-like deaminating enzyme